jgi:hypothetical protein
MNMEYNSWEDYLVYEHELIERAMQVLERCLDEFDETIHEPTRMKRALDFLLEFGDGMHNAKEEDFLFPLLIERGVPKEQGPIGVMLTEHEHERGLLADKLSKADGLKDAGADDRESFRSECREYLKMRAEHIWKENDVLYVMGRKVLTDEDNLELLQKFGKHNSEHYGEYAIEKYARMVEEMEKEEGVRRRLIENLSYEQLHDIMETLPFELTFVDADDTVAYFNRLDKPKIFTRTRSAIGRKVLKCHPGKSVERVAEIVEGFKNGTLENADFWIDFKGDKVLIRYFPVYDEDGDYKGVIEVTQEIGWIRDIEGQKRLLQK